MCEGRGGAEGWDARVDERTISRSRDMTGSKAPLIASGYQQGARATAMLQGGSLEGHRNNFEGAFRPHLKNTTANWVSTQKSEHDIDMLEFRCLAPLLRVC